MGQEIRKKLKKEANKNFCFSDDVMIGHTHVDRIEHWLHLFGIDSDNKDVGSLRRQYEDVFLKYANKNGFFNRWEIRLKRDLNYKSIPNWSKVFLQSIKRMAGLNRER